MTPRPEQVLFEVMVTAEMIRAYAARVGDVETLESDCSLAPPTFVLSLRRGFSPDVAIAADSFAMYGGHELTFHHTIRAGRSYAIRARVLDTYEKSGRSGPMTIVVRRAEVTDERGQPVAELIERQVVRRKLAAAQTAEARQQVSPTLEAARNQPAPPTLPIEPPREVGDELGPEIRPGPSAAHVAGYADDNHVHESLFVDQAFAQRLGYRDVIVPGPMQTAFLEQFLRRHFRGWRLASIGATFRLSIITGEPIRLSGVATEVDHLAHETRIGCDLVIENAEGERATIGSAALCRNNSVGIMEAGR